MNRFDGETDLERQLRSWFEARQPGSVPAGLRAAVADLGEPAATVDRRWFVLAVAMLFGAAIVGAIVVGALLQRPMPGPSAAGAWFHFEHDAADTQVRLVSSSDGEVLAILPHEQPIDAAAISPDGAWIAYRLAPAPPAPSAPSTPGEVFALDLDGGRLIDLGPGTGESLGAMLSWSPDGRYLAFTAEGGVSGRAAVIYDTEADVRRVAAIGGEPTYVYAAGFADADSVWLSVLTFPRAGPEQVTSHLVPIEGVNAVDFRESAELSIDDTFGPIVSPDGAHALAWRGSFLWTGFVEVIDGSLVIADLESNGSFGSDQALLNAETQDFDPVGWSKDGNWFAVRSHSDGILVGSVDDPTDLRPADVSVAGGGVLSAAVSPQGEVRGTVSSGLTQGLIAVAGDGSRDRIDTAGVPGGPVYGELLIPGDPIAPTAAAPGAPDMVIHPERERLPPEISASEREMAVDAGVMDPTGLASELSGTNLVLAFRSEPTGEIHAFLITAAREVTLLSDEAPVETADGSIGVARSGDRLVMFGSVGGTGVRFMEATIEGQVHRFPVAAPGFGIWIESTEDPTDVGFTSSP